MKHLTHSKAFSLLSPVISVTWTEKNEKQKLQTHICLTKKSLSSDESESEVAQLCLTLCDPMACNLHQAPPSMEFSRQEYWSGLPFPSPGDLPDSGIEPMSSTLQQMLYPLSHQGSPDGLFSKQSTLMNESTVNNYIFIITCICIVCKLYLYICCCFSLYLSSVYLPAYLENLYIYIYIYSS